MKGILVLALDLENLLNLFVLGQIDSVSNLGNVLVYPGYVLLVDALPDVLLIHGLLLHPLENIVLGTSHESRFYSLVVLLVIPSIALFSLRLVSHLSHLTFDVVLPVYLFSVPIHLGLVPLDLVSSDH
jgi:hypothetical protein